MIIFDVEKQSLKGKASSLSAALGKLAKDLLPLAESWHEKKGLMASREEERELTRTKPRQKVQEFAKRGCQSFLELVLNF